jgi:hypothetical protein
MTVMTLEKWAEAGRKAGQNYVDSMKEKLTPEQFQLFLANLMTMEDEMRQMAQKIEITAGADGVLKVSKITAVLSDKEYQVGEKIIFPDIETMNNLVNRLNDKHRRYTLTATINEESNDEQ